MHQLSNMTESTLVYSTEIGRIKAHKEPVQRPKGDGVVRIQKQTSGRKGAGVSVQEVNRLLKQFEQTRFLMKRFGKGMLGKMMRGMKGMLPGMGR